MTEHRDGRQQDLVLDPNQYSYVQDQTSGQIYCYRGPSSSTVSAQDVTVRFDPETKRFIKCSTHEAIRSVVQVREGEYVVLTNPDAEGKFPESGANKSWNLEDGKTVNIPGPISFALWPGQSAEVIPGHALKSNEYLVVEVYGEDDNHTVEVPQGDESPSKSEGDAVETPKKVKLAVGQQLVIQGTDTPFYLPPTGIRVVPDRNGNLIRSAETLEMLEYCILLDESGEKRYVEGPTVVFPKPTEEFVESDGKRIFKALELNELQGVYVVVSQTYTEDDVTYNEGDELFITGKDTRFYIPRNEHTIVQYGDRTKHYSVAIPKGEARYLMNRKTGEIRTVEGPNMYLANPIEEVFVKRALKPKLVELLYPGNQEALDYNKKLADQDLEDLSLGLVSQVASRTADAAYLTNTSQQLRAFAAGSTSNRGTSYTAPRHVSLEESKYDGAPTIDVWPGYAIYILSKSGGRRVVEGPAHVILDYDEVPVILEFSTGNPKSSKNLLKTPYLKRLNNKVSDSVVVETKDVVDIGFHLSYRVNFSGDNSEKWFEVENYTEFLSQRIRSIVGNAAKKMDLLEINDDPIGFVRSAILGDNDQLEFLENGMVVTSVDVINFAIRDSEIREAVVENYHADLNDGIERSELARNLAMTELSEDVNRRIIAQKDLTKVAEHDSEIARLERAKIESVNKVNNEFAEKSRKVELEMGIQEELDSLNQADLNRKKAVEDQRLLIVKTEIENELIRIQGEAEAFIKKVGAVDENLTVALQAFADKALIGKLAESMAPLAILGGGSVVDIVRGFLDGTPLNVVLNQLGESPLGTSVKTAIEKISDQQKESTHS